MHILEAENLACGGSREAADIYCCNIFRQEEIFCYVPRNLVLVTLSTIVPFIVRGANISDCLYLTECLWCLNEFYDKALSKNLQLVVLLFCFVFN